jgi:hypothetical protein
MASVCLILTRDLNVPSVQCIAIAGAVYSQWFWCLFIFVKHVVTNL